MKNYIFKQIMDMPYNSFGNSYVIRSHLTLIFVKRMGN